MSRIRPTPWPDSAPRDLTAALRARDAGQIGPQALLEQCLQRTDTLDGEVRAWVQVATEAARATAAWQEGLPPAAAASQPLLGIAIGIKDIIDVAGLPTGCGSPLRVAHRAARDAPIVSILRDLGAIILGKTATTQFACGDPSPTRNPWHLEHSPGGSSAGSAAAVASGMCFAALGTQTGGSITRPASFCGVASFKGRHGAWPLTDIVPVSENLDHVGPHARSARDLALLWALIESRLRPTRRVALEATARAITDGHWLEDMTPPRLWVIDEYFGATSEADAGRAYQNSLEKLEAAGARLERLALPASFVGVHHSQRTIMAVDAATYHRADYAAQPGAYAPGIAAMMDGATQVTAIEYRGALVHQQQFRAALGEALGGAGRGRIAITPATVSDAPPLSARSTGDPQFNAVWSLAGLPTCTVPASLSSRGLPLGVQLGAAHESLALFRAAAWCEAVLGCPRLD